MFAQELIIEETPEWLENSHVEPFEVSDDFIVEGRKKLTIDDEADFCSKRILQDIMKNKVRVWKFNLDLYTLPTRPFNVN